MYLFPLCPNMVTSGFRKDKMVMAIIPNARLYDDNSLSMALYNSNKVCLAKKLQHVNSPADVKKAFEIELNQHYILFKTGCTIYPQQCTFRWV